MISFRRRHRQQDDRAGMPDDLHVDRVARRQLHAIDLRPEDAAVVHDRAALQASPSSSRSSSACSVSSSIASSVGSIVLEHRAQIVGQRRRELERLAGARLRERQPLGVQERARRAAAPRADRAARGGGRRRRAQSPTIGWPIALRCTRIWCVRPVAIATRSSDSPGHVPRPGDPRHRRSRAPRARRDLLAMHRIAPDRDVDALALLHQAPDQRDVLLLDFAIVKLPRQLLVRGVVLGDDHHARRALVEPMHDARPQLAADAAQIGDVVEQRVDERAARRVRRRDARPCPPAC